MNGSLETVIHKRDAYATLNAVKGKKDADY
jgi:hypothetical protein